MSENYAEIQKQISSLKTIVYKIEEELKSKIAEFFKEKYKNITVNVDLDFDTCIIEVIIYTHEAEDIISFENLLWLNNLLKTNKINVNITNSWNYENEKSGVAFTCREITL